MGYLDDIIIFSKTEEEHLQHLEEIFVRLRKFGLKMKREKCSFFKKHIQYLGHLVSEKGFEPLPEKLESIRKMPAPRTGQRGEAIPWINRILPKIRTTFCGHFKAINQTYMTQHYF